MTFRSYCKCVLTNKATLVGYVLTAPAAWFYANGMDDLGMVTAVYAASFLILTSFGLETHKVYKKTLEGLLTYGEYYALRTDGQYRLYCDRAGYKLALREFRAKAE